MTHTPTPWKLRGKREIVSDNGTVLVECQYPSRAMVGTGAYPGACATVDANAAHIVKCVNAHDTLVQALNDIIEGCERRLRKGPDNGDALSLHIARTALAKLSSGA